jgi:isocitrate dehydrogenase
MAAKFKLVFEQLSQSEDAIVAELRDAQGGAVDIGGYYHPDSSKVSSVMRPSSLLNGIISAI